MHRGRYPKSFFGQGATEYLVLLAVVLIIALVSVALLGFFPGMADDAKMTESMAYWRSASPIAISEASATIDSNGEWTQVLLILKNNGGVPIELLGIGPTFYYMENAPGGVTVSWTATLSELGSIRTTYGEYQWMTPDILSYENSYGGNTIIPGNYMIYIGPPKGTGFSYYHTERNMLQPGEEIKIGITYYMGDIASSAYPIRSQCRNGGKSIDIRQLNIYYVPITEGTRIVKHEIGAKPFVAKCTGGSPFW